MAVLEKAGNNTGRGSDNSGRIPRPASQQSRTMRTGEYGYIGEGNGQEGEKLSGYENPVFFTTGEPERVKNPWDSGSRNGAGILGGDLPASGVRRDNGGPKVGSSGNTMSELPVYSGTGDSGQGGLPGITQQDPAQERELERLRRIEANYEKDKAMLAKEKTPALARSDSHEVGHAEGGDTDYINPEKALLKISDNLLKELAKRSGI
jgi:hypothetical protein